MTLSGATINTTPTRTPLTAQLVLSQLGPFSQAFRTPDTAALQLQGRQAQTHALFPGVASLAWVNGVIGMQKTAVIQIPMPAIDYDDKINAPPTIIIGTIMQPEPALLTVGALQHAATAGGDIGFRSPAAAVLTFAGSISALALDTPDADLISFLSLSGLEPTVIPQSITVYPESALMVAPGFAIAPVGVFIPFQWIDVDPAPVVDWS
jgi:hypothetical protein